MPGCFECTQWHIFKDAPSCKDFTDLQEYTEAVMGFTNKCKDDVTVLKTVKTHANNKPWLTGEVCLLLRSLDAAFRSGNTAAYWY